MLGRAVLDSVRGEIDTANRRGSLDSAKIQAWKLVASGPSRFWASCSSTESRPVTLGHCCSPHG
jgi:hypothetical protein